MKPVSLSGLQLAILILVVTFAGAPAAKILIAAFGLGRDADVYLSRLVSFSIGAILFAGIPAVRAQATSLLATPVPPSKYPEVAFAIVLFALGQFAIFGLYAASKWVSGGDEAVMRMALNPDHGRDATFAASTLRDLAITALAAPLIEEIAYRGFLFRKWLRTRGLVTAMMMSSAVFSVVHPSPLHAFFAGLLLCALFLRTAALRACILVHFCANALNWYPLLGQFVIPADNRGIESWHLQLACLALVPVAIVSYAWFTVRTRDPCDASIAALGRAA